MPAPLAHGVTHTNTPYTPIQTHPPTPPANTDTGAAQTRPTSTTTQPQSHAATATPHNARHLTEHSWRSEVQHRAQHQPAIQLRRCEPPHCRHTCRDTQRRPPHLVGEPRLHAQPAPQLCDSSVSAVAENNGKYRGDADNRAGSEGDGAPLATVGATRLARPTTTLLPHRMCMVLLC